MSQSQITRVVIADDHIVFRAALHRLFETQVDFRVVAESGIGGELCAAMSGLRAEILLLSVHAPGFEHAAIISHVLQLNPDTAIVALTTVDDDRFLSAIVNSGAVGLLLATVEPENLFDTLRRVARGETLFTRHQMARARQWSEEVEQPWLNLTERERCVTMCLAKGLDNRQIAAAFGLGLRTVETYVAQAMEKLHVSSRFEAAVWVRDRLPEVWWHHADRATA